MRFPDPVKVFDFLPAAALGTIMLLTVAAVFQRYVMSTPIAWLEEVNGLLFLWAIMLGSAAAKGAGSHLSIDILTSLLPPKGQWIMSIVVEALTLLVAGLMSWYGYLLASQVQFKITNVLGIPYSYIDYAVPAGGIGIALFSIRNIVALCKGPALSDAKELN